MGLRTTVWVQDSRLYGCPISPISSLSGWEHLTLKAVRRWPSSNPLLSSHFKWQFIHSHIVDNHWLSAAGCRCGKPQSQRWKWTGALVCRPGTNCGLVPPMPPSPLPLSMTCASYSSYCLELQVSICLYGMSPLQQPATPPTTWFLLFALVNL